MNMMGTANAIKKNHKVSTDENPAVSKTIRVILERAIKTGASDVHIEPRAGYGVVRQRIDGLLQVTTKLPGASFGEVVSYLKKLGGLNTKQRRAPQHGRYKLALGRRSYDVQIATLPVLDGERITLHITDAELTPTTLAELGFWGTGLGAINRALAQPHGLIVVGSTDQTSSLLALASMMHTLSSPHLNMASVEQDQIYQLPNVNQLLVKKDIGMTFARRLKQTLDREPNVVMVSDVLDRKTARTIVQAASNRQLVLAGLHAADAASALNGLNQLSNEPTALASAMQVTISPNLVAKLCERCREAYTPDASLIRRLAEVFGTDNPARMLKLHKLETEALSEQLGVGAGLASSAQASTSDTRILRLWRAHAGGCKDCNRSGLGGRITISEVIPAGKTLQSGLQQSVGVAELRQTIRTGSGIPLALDALVKALRGQLTIETVLAHTTSR